jgi:HK97 gp10 family phage protein
MATRVITGKAFKWEGVDEMKKLFNSMAQQLGPDGMGEAREQLKDILLKPAMMIRDEAIDLAPEGPTGRLKKAVKAEKAPEGERGAVVWVAKRSKDGGVFYARFVERGTSKMAAKPFFRPAILAVKPLIANVIAQDMKPLLEGMATKLGWHPGKGAPPG